MNEAKYIRLVQTSVTCFLYNEDKYLFLKRNLNKRIDPGRLNGVGGRLEPTENYLEAAVREVEEETGFKVNIDDIKLCGVIKLEGGYQEDWVMCFFKIYVPTQNIPKGSTTEDGEFIWIDKDEILTSNFELVDDLYYCMEDVINGEDIFFINAQLNEKQKIFNANITKLPTRN